MNLYLEIADNFCTIAGTLSMFNGLLTYPNVFNRSIIPGIEKKIGQKLGYYHPMYKRLPYAKVLGRYDEIATYITVKCIVYALGKDPDKFRVLPKTSALQRVNYPFALFSKREIVWSCLAFINFPMFLVCGSFVMFMNKYYPLH